MLEQIPGYVIGLARADGVAELLGIDVAAGAIFPEEDLPAHMRDRGLPLSFFETAAREGRLFVARQEALEWPVGFAVSMHVDGTSHLYELAVLPDHGRKGLGRALVEAVVEQSRERGDTSVTLTTFRHLAWNAPFYMKLGFEMLDAEILGPELAHCLEAEVCRGLDPAKRVAMRLALKVV
ncbi:MAG: GNAT family N-acetyltransferase [Myxococcota bacterium]